VPGIDRLSLLDELQAIARTGLAYAENPYDIERYEHLLDLAVRGYESALDLPGSEIRERLARDLGYVTTKVGADAAIFDADERILLVQRADDASWGLVAGWVEPGEDPAATVVREVREEVGLDVTEVELVAAVGRAASAEYGPHGAVALVFLCTVGPGEPVPNHESLQVAYRRIEEVDPWHKNHDRLAELALAHKRRRADRLSS
jgi:ADP-ribose pyrophosphatase YjhB (NUDIX family)